MDGADSTPARKETPVILADAMAPWAPGPLQSIGSTNLRVAIAADAGGRLASVNWRGREWLQGHGAGHKAMIAWGCFPMVPWAGRLRDGRFNLDGRQIQLARNSGHHAIHGLGFATDWDTLSRNGRTATLELQLPCDQHWPFGGVATQRFDIDDDGLQFTLSVTAGASPMPCVLGWHPWFRKPQRLQFHPELQYPRDADGIATRPPGAVRTGPWDDCFIQREPVVLEADGQRLQITSSCDHWVIYDQPASTTCVEPQSGPPDAFNLEPAKHLLRPGETRSEWMRWQFSMLND